MSSVEVYFKTKIGKPVFYILQIFGIIFSIGLASENSFSFIGWLIVQLVIFGIIFIISHAIDYFIYSFTYNKNSNINLKDHDKIHLTEKGRIKVEEINYQLNNKLITKEQYLILIKEIIRKEAY